MRPGPGGGVRRQRPDVRVRRGGQGHLPLATVFEAEFRRRYNVQVVGRVKTLRQHFYAISVDRRIQHPAVMAIIKAARQEIGRLNKRCRLPRARFLTPIPRVLTMTEAILPHSRWMAADVFMTMQGRQPPVNGRDRPARSGPQSQRRRGDRAGARRGRWPGRARRAAREAGPARAGGGSANSWARGPARRGVRRLHPHRVHAGDGGGGGVHLGEPPRSARRCWPSASVTWRWRGRDVQRGGALRGGGPPHGRDDGRDEPQPRHPRLGGASRRARRAWRRSVSADDGQALARAEATSTDARAGGAVSDALQREITRTMDWREWVWRKPRLSIALAFGLGLFLGRPKAGAFCRVVKQPDRFPYQEAAWTSRGSKREREQARREHPAPAGRRKTAARGLNEQATRLIRSTPPFAWWARSPLATSWRAWRGDSCHERRAGPR